MSRTVKIMLCIVLVLMILIGGMMASIGINQRKTPDWEELYTAGIGHMDEGNYEDAVAVFLAAIETDPARYEAYVAQGDAYMCLEQFDEALRVYEKAYDLAPDNQNAVQERLERARSAVSAMTEPPAETEETIPETTVAETEPIIIAEPEEKKIARITTLYNNEVSGETIFHYDNSGKLLQKVTSGYNNGVKTYSLVTEYRYDSAGMLVGIQEADSPFTEKEFHYDFGVLTGYTYNEIMGDVVANTLTYHYERDEKGNVVKVTTSSLSPDLWLNGEYTYDEQGRCVSACEHERYGDHEFQRTMTYDHANKGAVIVTREETLFGFANTNRQIQFGEMEYGYIYGPELYDGYSVVVDADEYIAGVRDENGQLVASFEYITEYSANPVKQVKQSPEKITFADIPSKFTFASGAGAWMTVLTVNEDGSFTGEYHDSEMGIQGEGYSRGTVYICNFEGKFTEPKKADEFIYSMNLESFQVAEPAGRIYYEDEIRYILSEPVGMQDAGAFYLYLPGAAMSALPKDFLVWCDVGADIRDTLPTGYYGIYNAGGKTGFNASEDNNIWSKDYMYYYQDRKAALWPSYYSESDLVFWPESGASEISLEFAWREDDQTEFDAVDKNGSGKYHISVDFSDDLKTAWITVASAEKVDLSPWGGTADGHLSAVFVEE